jgi:hypothetical protein
LQNIKNNKFSEQKNRTDDKEHLSTKMRQLTYRKPTAACHTNASNKKNTGMTGSTSTKGLKIWYASGSFANKSAASMFV